MKKRTKILLISLGTIAAIVGIAGTVYGSSTKLQNWFDEKINPTSSNDNYPTYNESDFENEDDNQGTSQGSGSGSNTQQDDSGGNQQQNPGSQEDPEDDNPGSQEDPEDDGPGGQEEDDPEQLDEGCEIQLSQSRICVYDTSFGAAQSEPFSANIIGTHTDNRLVWVPSSAALISTSKPITHANEQITLTANWFSGRESIRVYMISNPSIYKDLIVEYANEPTTLAAYSYGVAATKEGSILKSNDCMRSSSTTVDYSNNAGVYFATNKTNNSERSFFNTPEDAIDEDNIVRATVSPGTYFCFKMRVDVRKDSMPTFRNEYFFTEDWKTFTVPVFTNVEFIDSAATATRYVSGTYEIYYRVRLPLDFEGKTGQVCFKMRTKYYAFKFMPYYGVSNIGLDENTIDLGAE